jgi:hypothetical protein
MTRPGITNWLSGGLIVFVVIALIGCGGGNDGASTPSTATTASAPPPFEAADALITLADMPTGWAVEPDDDSKSDFCGTGGSLSDAAGVQALDKAEAQYTEGGNIPLLFHGVGAYAPGQAHAVVSKFREIIAGCTTMTLDDGEKLDVASVSFPNLGDESVPILFTGEVEGFNIGLYAIVIRIADGLTVVSYGGIAPDVAEVERLARLATDKLRAAQAPAP